MRTDWDLTPDSSRETRLGFDESVFCANKSVDQVSRIVDAALCSDKRLLLTRLAPDKHASLPKSLHTRLDYEEISGTAFLGPLGTLATEPQVAIVSAGTSDVGVAREAVRTLRYYGITTSETYDVGVAGLWRLLERVETLRSVPVVITVAGMEGTLPSVVAGLVPGCVIAVPVSNGYGVAAGGRAALSSALASCAPGLVVVNIDNGYGAACAALRILNAMSRDAAGDS
jgi:NCAIR mutase (PurE)-related protein